MIIEQTYGLEILWEEIDEPNGTTILGGLAPRQRRIVLNSKHEALFVDIIGPERFTLAHEFAHWVYDADSPEQLSLDLDTVGLQPYCYAKEPAGLSEDHRIREMNANKLAAHLLLPESLLRRPEHREKLRDLSVAAKAWGVSLTALGIRLQDLGILI
ncbi:MAG: ImmA/IrrE family metallo-endopeptidase [Chloroflexi bacterium]|nr:ImmA/IrrE family metallo-endopeptidase [Chloroflexota bacterium]